MTPWKNRLFSSRNNRLFRSVFDDFFKNDSLIPAMNIKEHKNDFEIEFAAPGFNKKDFDVSIENNILRVYGKNDKEEQKDKDFYFKEFSYKSLKRFLSLPASVDLNQNVKASYKNGLLKIKLLKKDEVPEEPAKKIIKVD